MIEYEIHFENKSEYEAGYEQASNDVWAMACELYYMSEKDLLESFRGFPFTDSVEKVIISYNEYKARKAKEAEDAKLHVGDEVIDGSGNACVITNIDTSIHVIYNKNHKTHKWGKNTKFKKTGNHFDMIEL